LPVVYLNGRFLPLEEARIPVLDRGFIFGDGVYEVIPVFGRHVLRLGAHLSRLQDSLDAIYIANPHTGAEWASIVDELLRLNPEGEDRSIYIEITRGVAPRDHLIPPDLPPTVFALCKPIPRRDFSAGISAITHEDIRWKYCNIKAISLLPGVLLRERARRRDGSSEAILIRDGLVTEGAASNVFVVQDGVAHTPPKSNWLLPGITRDLVVDLLRAAGLPCEEGDVPAAMLSGAGEIWVTSSTMGIAPVTRLDGQAVGDGTPGDYWRQADALYQAFKNNPPVN
jgi:D-alanine transaminase